MDYVNYRISEANYNRLYATRKQISLIAGLVSELDHDQALNIIEPSELYYFLDAQCDTLKSIVDDIDTFHDAQKGEPINATFPGEVFVDLIEACSGLSVDSDQIEAISKILTDWAMVDQAGGEAIKAFFAALQRAGWDVTQTIKNGDATWSYSKRPDAV